MTDPATSPGNVEKRHEEKTEGTSGTMRGGHDPAELGRRSAEARARRAEHKEPDDSDSAIIAALRKKASKGDVNAARELREWRDREHDTLQGEGWLEVLDENERLLVRRVIGEALDRVGSRTREQDGGGA